MKTKETMKTLNKQQAIEALEWWNGLPDFDEDRDSKQSLTTKHIRITHFSNLTGREIKEIWRKETNHEKES